MLLPERITIENISHLFKGDFLNLKYPMTQDCVKLDQQILSLKKDIDEVTKAKLKKQALFVPVYLDKLLVNLKKKLKEKENVFSLSDCRNQIENKRVEETASVFSSVSAQNEKIVLDQSKTKQYLLIGAGSVILITALTIILMKKNK